MAVKKVHEKKLDVAEMRMLRWMWEVTKLDEMRNERIRGMTKVGEMSMQVKKRLRWFGHVVRRDEDCVGKKSEVQGTRKGGRPKQRWMGKIKEDVKWDKMRKKSITSRIPVRI